MLVDQFGIEIRPSRTAPSATMQQIAEIAQREALRMMERDFELSRLMRSRLVDEQGDPIYFPGKKIGDTVHVKKPTRWKAREV